MELQRRNTFSRKYPQFGQVPSKNLRALP